MNIAYIVSAYKYPELLVRLVLKLNTQGTSFLLHFDQKTDQKQYDRVVQGLKHLPNVYFLERHKCHWGDVGHINATIKGIRTLFEKKIPFDYVVLLTGQDYPIKPNEQIQAFFEQNWGKSFMEFFPVNLSSTEVYPVSAPLWSARIQRWHFVLFNKLRAIPNKLIPLPIKRSFPKGFKVFIGSSYWCLFRDCIEYLYEFINQNSEFVKFFDHVSVSDEVFFQTILLNSPLKKNIINDDMRYIEWTGENWSGIPKILGQDDFVEMMASPKLFARKFDPTQDASVLDSIDRMTNPNEFLQSLIFLFQVNSRK